MDVGKLSSHNGFMRRRPGTLLPLEAEILAAGMELRRTGTPEFHGFELAKWLAAGESARRLTAHGTLYKALGRLGDAGLLESRWEDPEIGALEGRPRRRLYTVSGAGQVALVEWRAAQADATFPGRVGLEPT
jgi:PadR family transcriptional regulator, regulatory protein PadR